MDVLINLVLVESVPTCTKLGSKARSMKSTSRNKTRTVISATVYQHYVHLQNILIRG